MRNDKEAGVCYKLVSVPFNAGRGLMHSPGGSGRMRTWVSVPFNAGRGLMRSNPGDLVLDPFAFQYPSMRVVD